MISTIDYDIVLYYDKFDFVIEACKNNDLNGLKQIPSLHYYVNEKLMKVGLHLLLQRIMVFMTWQCILLKIEQIFMLKIIIVQIF